MKRYLGLFFARTPGAKPTPSRGFLSRFLRDDRGSYIVLMAVALPALIGVAGLGTEGGWWLYNHRVNQSAADNAAYSAATAYAIDSTVNITSEAKAVSASNYNLVDGQNGVTVTVNKPPTGLCAPTSAYVGNNNAIEVAVQHSLSRFFSGFWQTGNVTICGRAVAIIRSSGDCILALASAGKGIYATKNNLNIDLTACSMFSDSAAANSISLTGNNDSITTDTVGAVGGINISGNQKTTVANSTTGDAAIPDPYAASAASWPATCAGTCTVQTVCTPSGTPKVCTLQPGVYIGGINLTSNNSTYNMASGVYYLSGNLTFSGNHITLNGTGVTIVITGATSIVSANSQNSSINISAPTTGWSAGIAIWEPTSTAPASSPNVIAGNSFVANITGAIYTPKAAWDYEGNTGATPTCTQIVAQTIQFGGNSVSFTGNCTSVPGLKQFGQLVALVE